MGQLLTALSRQAFIGEPFRALITSTTYSVDTRRGEPLKLELECVVFSLVDMGLPLALQEAASTELGVSSRVRISQVVTTQGGVLSQVTLQLTRGLREANASIKLVLDDGYTPCASRQGYEVAPILSCTVRPFPREVRRLLKIGKLGQ